jgi:hypothetical protein
LIVLPHARWTFALAMLGEYLFQAIAFAIQIGIVFEVIGESNPWLQQRLPFSRPQATFRSPT